MDHLTLAQLSVRIGISQSRLYAWTLSGISPLSDIVLRKRKVGDEWVVTREDWKLFVRRVRKEGPSRWGRFKLMDAIQRRPFEEGTGCTSG